MRVLRDARNGRAGRHRVFYVSAAHGSETDTGWCVIVMAASAPASRNAPDTPNAAA